MLCYAMLCYAMLCYAMLCYAMLCYAMLCYAMLCYAMLCYAVIFIYPRHLSTCLSTEKRGKVTSIASRIDTTRFIGFFQSLHASAGVQSEQAVQAAHVELGNLVDIRGVQLIQRIDPLVSCRLTR
jgi:hypothetical protein